MIRLGLRLTLGGGREAAVRLVLLVAAVGVGVGLLLTAVAGVNAVNKQNDRYAWFSTGISLKTAYAAKTSTDPSVVAALRAASSSPIRWLSARPRSPWTMASSRRSSTR